MKPRWPGRGRSGLRTNNGRLDSVIAKFVARILVFTDAAAPIATPANWRSRIGLRIVDVPPASQTIADIRRNHHDGAADALGPRSAAGAELQWRASDAAVWRSACRAMQRSALLLGGGGTTPGGRWPRGAAVALRRPDSATGWPNLAKSVWNSLLANPPQVIVVQTSTTVQRAGIARTKAGWRIRRCAALPASTVRVAPRRWPALDLAWGR